jgi:hypothetical protein
MNTHPRNDITTTTCCAVDPLQCGALGTERYDMFGRTKRAEAAPLLILTTSVQLQHRSYPSALGQPEIMHVANQETLLG